MIRAFLDEVLLFALPFALFALYLVLRRRHPLRWEHWSGPALGIVAAGLALVGASFVLTGLTAEREPGGYVPTHLENGRVVPGTFRRAP